MAQKIKNPCFIGISGIYGHKFYLWYASAMVRWSNGNRNIRL